MQRNHLAAVIAATLVSGLALAYTGYGWHRPMQGSSDTAATTVSATPMNKDAITAAARLAPKPEPWVKLDIETPRYNKNKDPVVPLMLTGGFPLVFKASVRSDALGIAMDSLPSDFPNQGQTGYVILANPDNCLALPPPYESSCPNSPSDETYIEFTPDIDQLGAVDDAGNPARNAALADESISGQPLLLTTLNVALPDTLIGVGPPTLLSQAIPGTTPTQHELVEVDDGYGYGADDDLPGLVVLSDVGVGRVLNPDFSRPAQLQLRNLAGFLNWVGYELVSSSRQVQLHAGMVAPDALFSPLMRTDDCIGTPADPSSSRPCADKSAMYRIDGGPIIVEPSTNGPGGYQFNFPKLYPGRIFQVHAFMVSGTAPSTLADMDGNGIVDASDATLAGYTVISNQAAATFRQRTTRHCVGPWMSNTLFADYDGNGYILPSLVCGAGPGQITQIPD